MQELRGKRGDGRLFKMGLFSRRYGSDIYNMQVPSYVSVYTKICWFLLGPNTRIAFVVTISRGELLLAYRRKNCETSDGDTFYSFVQSNLTCPLMVHYLPC